MLHLYRFHTLQRTFSRSYGTILPSSFTRVLSSALVFSTRPPVSVWGTAYLSISLEAFPGSLASAVSPARTGLLSPLGIVGPDLPEPTPYRLLPTTISWPA